jgi:hypothetical protein
VLAEPLKVPGISGNHTPFAKKRQEFPLALSPAAQTSESVKGANAPETFETLSSLPPNIVFKSHNTSQGNIFVTQNRRS